MQYTDIDRTNDFMFFKEMYDDIYEEYGHKYVAIRNREIIGVYDSIPEGISDLSPKYPLGTYIIQECNGDESGYTNWVTSWQLVSV